MKLGVELAVRYNEDDLKELLIETFENKHGVLLTKSDIEFGKNFNPTSRRLEEVMVQVNVSLYQDLIKKGQKLRLTEEK